MVECMTATIPASHLDLLSSNALAHIATIGPSGAPQSSPVWFGWDGNHLLFSLTTGRQKYRNLTANPAIALSIVDPANPYRYLEVRGTISDIADDIDNAFINSMAKKYINEDIYPWHQPTDHRVVIHVQPTATTQMG
jgi:PPOX class probable F420-dependent enzyme